MPFLVVICFIHTEHFNGIWYCPTLSAVLRLTTVLKLGIVILIERVLSHLLEFSNA